MQGNSIAILIYATHTVISQHQFEIEEAQIFTLISKSGPFDLW